MKIKLESEIEYLDPMNTFEVWAKVINFMNEYKVTQKELAKHVGFELRKDTKVKEWSAISPVLQEKFLKLKKFIESPEMIKKVSKGKHSFREEGLDRDLISTDDIAKNVINELKNKNIPLRVFTHKVIGFKSAQLVNNYLLNPKPWNDLSEIISRYYLKMFCWLKDQNRFDVFKNAPKINQTASEHSVDTAIEKSRPKRVLKIVVEKLNSKSIEVDEQMLTNERILPQLRSKTQSNSNHSSRSQTGEINEIDEISYQLKRVEKANKKQEDLIQKLQQDNNKLKEFQQTLRDELKGDQLKNSEKQIDLIDELENKLKEQKIVIDQLKEVQKEQQTPETCELKKQLKEQKEKVQLLTYKTQNFENDNQNIKLLMEQMLFQQRQLQQSQLLQQQQIQHLQMNSHPGSANDTKTTRADKILDF